ncbi:MAG: hypothetical protein ABL866_13025 [Devosia sp.]
MIARRAFLLGAAAALAATPAHADPQIIQLGRVTVSEGTNSVSINAAHQSAPTDRVWVQQTSGDAKITKVAIIFASGKKGIAREDKKGFWRLNTDAIVARADVTLSWPKGGNATIEFAGAYFD